MFLINYESDCYAKTTINGGDLSDEENEVFCCSYCSQIL